MNLVAVLKSSALILSLLFLASGCTQNKQEQSWQGKPAELPVAAVAQGNAVIAKEYATAIEGVSNVEIRPQVSGYLTKIYVDEGNYVRAGQVMFEIDSRSYYEQYNTAKANLTTAKIDLDRKKELVKEKIVSDLQVQQAQANYQVAEAQVESARINYEFCKIKAPVSGYIGRFNYRLGSLLAPANPEPITSLSDIHQVYAYFSMSENDFIGFQEQHPGNSIEEKLKNTAPISLLISNGKTYDVQGKIDAVEGQFSRSTGVITLRARFDNPKSFLRSGNTGKVVMEQTYSDAVLIPIASTIAIQDKLFVFAVDKESKAVQVPIEISGKSEDNYIVSKGLKPGDKYIVTGFDRLQAGTPVVAKEGSHDH